MIDTPELRLELLKIASKVVGSHGALMRVAEELRAYVLTPDIPETTLVEALNETLDPKLSGGMVVDALNDRPCLTVKRPSLTINIGALKRGLETLHDD